MENETRIVSENEGVEPAESMEKTDWNLPTLITVVAMLVWFGFQTLQLTRERANLSIAKSNQEGALQEAEKVRMQFESLMTNTSALANQGHVGAKMVVDELNRRGVGVRIESKAPSKDSKSK